MPHFLKLCSIMADGIAFHASTSQDTSISFVGARRCPAGVSDGMPSIIQFSQECRIFCLNGRLMLTSSGCTSGVRPPGITATSMSRRCSSCHTASVRWTWQLSQTSRRRLPQFSRGNVARTQSMQPVIQIIIM